jgi:hypothetical protein
MAAKYRERKKTTSAIHLKGGDSKYFGCETLNCFPWLRGGGSKYYGREIHVSNPLPYKS